MNTFSSFPPTWREFNLIWFEQGNISYIFILYLNHICKVYQRFVGYVLLSSLNNLIKKIRNWFRLRNSSHLCFTTCSQRKSRTPKHRAKISQNIIHLWTQLQGVEECWCFEGKSGQDLVTAPRKSNKSFSIDAQNMFIRNKETGLNFCKSKTDFEWN